MPTISNRLGIGRSITGDMMLKIFIGYDPRQPVSYTTLCHSIIQNCSRPVAITPLVLETLPLQRQGLTPFTFSRFLVPYLCDYAGWALFLDVDIMVRGDLAELFALADDSKAVMVSKNALRFEWASVMLFNNPLCNVLTPAYVETASKLHGIEWSSYPVGDLPGTWNHLVGYDPPDPEAKLVHFTQGVPAFRETWDCEFGAEWRHLTKQSVASQSWGVLMGNSVHSKPVYERLAKEGALPHAPA